MVGLTKVNKNVMEPVNVTQVVTNDDPQQNLEQVIGDGLVHVTGNETIAGVKTFEDDVKVVDSVVFTNSPSVGIKVDRDVPNWAWADLTSTIVVDGASPSTSPTYAVYRGNIRQHQFDVNDVVYCTFHIPHDYATGTNLFIHTHWSHNVVVLPDTQVTVLPLSATALPPAPPDIEPPVPPDAPQPPPPPPADVAVAPEALPLPPLPPV